MNEQRAAEATKVHRALAQYRLRGVSGTTFGKVYLLRASNILGRQEDCQIVVEDDGVSRQHVRLDLEGDKVRVQDLNSSNGTFINGQRVRSGLLGPGDELALDNVRFRLEVSGQVEQTPVPPQDRPVTVKADNTRPKAQAREGGSWLWLWVGGAAVLVALVLVLML